MASDNVDSGSTDEKPLDEANEEDETRDIAATPDNDEGIQSPKNSDARDSESPASPQQRDNDDTSNSRPANSPESSLECHPQSPSFSLEDDESQPGKLFEIGGVCVIKFHSQQLHRKYFGHVKHHLEQLLRETATDLSQLFCVDTARTEEAPPPNVVYQSVNNSSLLEDQPAAAAPSAGAPGGGGCFNCTGQHHMSECPKPIDRRAVAENRRKQQQSRPQGSNARFFKDEERPAPGCWSKRLLEAMGLSRTELPLFVYRMRVLGYPPGWLQEAEIETSGLKIFDGHGNEVKKVSSSKKKKNATLAAEDGEVLSGNSDNPDSDTEEEEGVKYDMAKLIEMPGFNMPLPNGCPDDYQRLGMPALQHQQMKSNAILSLNALKEASRLATRKRKSSTSKHRDDRNSSSKRTDRRDTQHAEGSNTSSAERVAGKRDTSKRKLNLPPPKCDVDTSNGDKEEDKGSVDEENTDGSPRSKRIRLDTAEDLKEGEVPEDDITAAADSQKPDDKQHIASEGDPTDDASATSHVKLRRSVSLGSTRGTPIPASISRVSSLPDAAKWSEGVAEHIPFENLPGATGTFDKMRDILGRIKTLRKNN